MAEFSEVMRQAARMCRAHEECEECPVNMIADMVPIGCLFGSGIDAEYIEEKIMDWAAEHPEPRYPSWHEAWKQLFPDGQGSPCPTAYGMKYEPEWCGSDDCKKNAKVAPSPPTSRRSWGSSRLEGKPMKTPDEIKKGLECCNTYNGCQNCPYDDIVGAETGNRKNKVIPEKKWVMDIAEACEQAGVPLFMKESLRKIMGDDFRQEFPWGGDANER